MIAIHFHLFWHSLTTIMMLKGNNYHDEIITRTVHPHFERNPLWGILKLLLHIVTMSILLILFWYIVSIPDHSNNNNHYINIILYHNNHNKITKLDINSFWSQSVNSDPVFSTWPILAQKGAGGNFLRTCEEVMRFFRIPQRRCLHDLISFL